MATFWRDVRFGALALLRTPGFTLVAVLTLALGIGVNGAIFSIVSGTLLNSLPWEDPSTIVGLFERNPRQDQQEYWVSTAKYPEWREQLRSFTDLAALYPWGFNLTDGGELDFVDAALVTPNNFSVLGIRPWLGRAFVPEDARPDAERVVVLSHGLWTRRYAADPAIVGRRLEIDGEPATIVESSRPINGSPGRGPSSWRRSCSRWQRHLAPTTNSGCTRGWLLGSAWSRHRPSSRS